MKEKIMNIKNILRIIISLFVIFSMVKSCAKALSITAVNNMLLDVKNNQAGNWYKNSTYNLAMTTIAQNELKAHLDGYDNIIFYNNGSNQVSVYIFNTPGNININSDYKLDMLMNGYAFDIPTSTQIINQRTLNGYWGNYQRVYLGGNYNNQNAYAMIAIAKNGVSGPGSSVSQFLGWKNYIDNPLSFGNLHSTKATFENQEVQVVQTLYSYSNTPIENFLGYEEGQEITFTLTNTKTNQVQENTFIWNENAYIGRNSNKSFYASDLGDYIDIGIDTRLITFNTIYNLKAVQGDHEKEVKIVFLPIGTTIENGSITSIPSGDFSYNVQDSTNDIIDNQNQNNTFWQDTYNNLFVMESGDVDRLITDMKQNIKIDNFGDVSGEIAILNTLTGEPSDFIIAWNPTQYMGKTIIPSGEINFSQKVREVPALKTTQDWLRIIMGYSITIVLMSEIFFTILRCLGVGVSIYEQHNEEIERLEEMHTPKIYDTEVMTPKGIKRYRTRRTRIQ